MAETRLQCAMGRQAGRWGAVNAITRVIYLYSALKSFAIYRACGATLLSSLLVASVEAVVFACAASSRGPRSSGPSVTLTGFVVSSG